MSHSTENDKSQEENKELFLALEYADIRKKMMEIRIRLSAIEAEMRKIKPLEEWNTELDDGRLHTTYSYTHSFDIDDEPLRVLADDPHIPIAERRRVIRLVPSTIGDLKGLAAYGTEEKSLVEECLKIVERKPYLSYQRK